MSDKIGFFETETATGKIEKSFTRLLLAWYFWAINLPASLALVAVAAVGAYKATMAAQELLTLLGYVFVLQLFWAAPKAITKYLETNGLSFFKPPAK